MIASSKQNIQESKLRYLNVKNDILQRISDLDTKMLLPYRSDLPSEIRTTLDMKKN